MDVVLPARAALGECPVWDWRTGRLFWIDIDARLLHCTDVSSGIDETRELPGRPGSLVLTDRIDHLVVAMEHQLVDVTWSTGEVVVRDTLEPDASPTRLNDGRCDRSGRFWVGSMDDPAGTGARAARLHRVEPNGTSVTVRADVGVSNGLAFSPDGTTMYWADTTRSTVWAYDYDAASGHSSNERVFLDFTDLPGMPDGACVDAEGCYWVACVYGWSLLRATPNGDVDRIIELPVEKPSMPAFGGPDMTTLFLTSISTGGSRAAAPGQPLAGALLALEPGVQGLREALFEA